MSIEKEETTVFTADEAVDREFDGVNEGDIVLEKIDEFASNIDFEKQSDAVTTLFLHDGGLDETHLAIIFLD